MISVFFNTISIAFLVSLIGGSQPELSKCDYSTIGERLSRAHSVFSGEAISVKSDTDGCFETRFKVAMAFKNAREAETSIFTCPFTAESPKFEVGRKYIVFAHVQGDELFAGPCSGTGNATKQAINELKRRTRKKNKA